MTCLPDSHTGPLLIPMEENVLTVLRDIRLSIIRPPQPATAPSAANDCHIDCWSLCDIRLVGTGKLRLNRSIFWVGMIRGPTLAITAALPSTYMSRMRLSWGCRAKDLNLRSVLKPPASATVMGNNSERFKAMDKAPGMGVPPLATMAALESRATL